MLKKNKILSMVMAVCLCLAVLAPVFVAPQAAEATSTYEAISAPTVKNTDTQNLGVVKVTLPDTALFAYSKVTVSLPTDVDLPNNAGAVAVSSTNSGNTVEIVAPGTGDALATTDFGAASFDLTSDNTFDITMNSTLTTTGSDKYFYIYFNGVKMNNISGDVTVSFDAPDNSGFSSTSDIVIAKAVSSGSTTTSVKKVANVNDAGGDINTITVAENSAGSLDLDGTVKLEILTDGYTWDDTAAATAQYGWAFADTSADTLTYGDNLSSDGQTLSYDINTNSDSYASAGKISFTGLKLAVDDSKAKAGDAVQVKVSGADIDATTLTVANYVDYGTTLEANTTESLIAGQNSQDIGTFYLEEGAAGSLVAGRTITLSLPSGIEWTDDNLGSYSVIGSGDITLSAPTVTNGDRNQTVKWTVTTPSATSGVKVEIKDMKVNVAPNFSGDLNLTVGGSAGISGTVKVGAVAPAATLATSAVNNIELGKANQKLNDVTITEGAAGALLEDNDIKLVLDDGYRFSDTPTVAVTTGDLDVDTNNVTLDGNILIIPVTGDSNTASTITISNLAVDAYRTAPEGAVTLQFVKGTSAVNETDYDQASPGKVVVANCITAAEASANGQFKIGSNLYQVNGVTKVMDVAPYIKDSRTFVPVRYLGYVLGLNDSQIAWDAASQKVTFTSGDNVVELTIGSNIITVNGEAQTMDVAPEITNSRTMLPARFIAEALGASVGWDAATYTVVISQ